MPAHTLHIVSNTHWDREWYLSFERFRLRLVQLMDRLLDLLERQPAYRFVLDGQFIPLKDYLEIRPERDADLRRFVAAGQLIIGPWYTQPLETLASGESMIRNLQLGMRKSREFGGCMPIAYMIDQFGHASQLPQILAGFGIPRAVIWRGVPAGYPAVFRWAASDGSEVLLYYSNDGYGEATALPIRWDEHVEMIDGTPFERQGLKQRVKGLVEHRRPKATTPHLLCLNGIDHSFAQEDLLEVIAAANAAFPELRLRQSTLEEYCAAVEDAHAAGNIPYHFHRGELMDSNEPVLKDIHSARADQKMCNRRAEGILERSAEPLAALAWLTGSSHPGGLLAQAWEYILQNHSHDSLGCSSVDAVYRQVLARYEWASDLGSEIAAQSLQALAYRSAAVQNLSEQELLLCVFNPLQWTRSEVLDAVIDIPLALGWEHFTLLDPTGRPVPFRFSACQDTITTRFNPLRGHASQIPITRCRIAFPAENIPGLGWQLYHIKLAPTSEGLQADGAHSEPSPIYERGQADGGQLESSPTCGNEQGEGIHSEPSPARGRGQGEGLWSEPSPTCGRGQGEGLLENTHLRVRLHPDGSFDLLDKASRRAFTGLHIFEDGGEAGNGYQHEAPAWGALITSRGLPAEIVPLEDSPLRSTVEIRLSLPLPAGLNPERTARLAQIIPCPLTVRLSLDSGARRLDIETRMDNRARDHRLRVRFPTGIPGPSYAEMPFDVTFRPPGTPPGRAEQWEQPRPTHPMHTFAGVEDASSGLMIANHGLYEYELADDPDHTLILTLLRCTDRIDAYPYGEMEETRIPAAQCPGETVFRYSLIPYSGGWQSVYAEACAFRDPLQSALVRLPEEGVLPGFDPNPLGVSLPARHSFVEIEPPGLILTALKQSEDGQGLLLRLLNLADEPVLGRLRVNLPRLVFHQVCLVRLDETRQQPLPLDKDGWITTQAPSRGLVTLLLYRA